MKKTNEPILKLRDVLVEYKNNKIKHKAVKSVSFDIFKGETFGLIGESGSGKTTIAKTIMGTENLTSGAIYFKDSIFRGSPPIIYKINEKINQNLEIIVKNNKLISVELNHQLNQFKRLFFKYQMSKFYDYKTKELRDYQSGGSKIIKEGVNLNQTKLANIKKNINLSVLSNLINSNLKYLLKNTRLQTTIFTFIDDVKQYLEIPKDYLDLVNKYLNLTSQQILDLQNLQNKIYFTINDISDLLAQVVDGKWNSAKTFFEQLGDKFKVTIQIQKEVNDYIIKVKQTQLINLFLLSYKSKKSHYLNTLIKDYKDFDKLTDYKQIIDSTKISCIDQLVEKSDLFKPKTSKELKSLKKNVQMIFQDPTNSLNQKISVRNIILEGIENYKELYNNNQTKQEYLKWFNENYPEHQITLEQIKPNDVKEFLLLRIINTIGLLPEHLSRYPHEFSGGQRQRIGIARALIMRPDLVIADEPISALDVSVRAQIINLLNKFQKEFNLTYIFIAHDLEVVRFIANRIAVIYRGDIVELAEANELFEIPLHPYTRSLLSASLSPVPNATNKKKFINYDQARDHYDYLNDFPKWVKVNDNHYVYANNRELESYKEKIKNYNKKKRGE